MLVDTGAWYAIADSSDRHHEEASRFYREHAGQTPFITTDLILAETWALLHSHLGRSAALTFWETLRETRIPILLVEPVDLEAAWHIVHAFPDQTYSFVDCTTFALMERSGITDALAFDTHFLTYRFGPGRQRALRVFPH
ncbi:MAG: PIN domain-containing protein [Deltaproteobacteria bacterium]|nr:PIN domain-containing protein [Deltaproteobacteria bacterium]